MDLIEELAAMYMDIKVYKNMIGLHRNLHRNKYIYIYKNT